MKIIKIASGKQKIKLSKREWESMGKRAGWMKESQLFYDLPDAEDPDWIVTQLKALLIDSETFWSNMTFQMGKSFKEAKAKKQFLKDMLGKLRNVDPTLEMFSKPERKAIATRILELQAAEKKDEERKQHVDELRNREDKPQEQLQPRQEAPTAVAEPEEETAVDPSLSQLDNSMFANKKEINDIKDLLLDRYTKKEITEDQLKTMLQEFAKKHNLNIKLSKSNGKLQVRIAKKDKKDDSK